ncbi:MAG: hypothetical protein ABL986_09845 [Vicinamibacterales bacterium]
MRTLPGDPWIRYRDTPLYAVPSIHCRLVFAQIVLEACRRKRFDVIAVELPSSLQRDGSLQRLAGMAPATAMLMRPFGRLVPVEVFDREGAEETSTRGALRRIDARQGAAIPITPADSIITALRCPTLLSRHWKDWHPSVVAIDAEHVPTSRATTGVRVADDYDVMVSGLAGFHHRWEHAWHSGRVDPVDDRRERVMASHLARYIKEGREVLFVCGAAHWHAVTKLLDEDAHGEDLRQMPRTAQPSPRAVQHMVAIDPSVAWVWGWLDDIPSVVWEHERACQEGTAATWDKREATERLLASALDRAHNDHHDVSPRRLMKMARYQRVLLAAAGRWTPELDGHLVHSARACVNGRFSRTLKELAHDYPAIDLNQTATAQLLTATDGRKVLSVGSEYFLCEPDDPGVGTGRRLPPLPPPALNMSERAELRRTKWVYRDWPAEQALHAALIGRARRLAHDTPPVEVVRPFTAGIGLGVAWRQTLRARATGLPDVYVRHSKPGRRTSPACDGHCPVVWIFDATSHVTQTFTGYVPREAQTEACHCYSAFYWLKSGGRLGGSPIQQFSVAYTVSLMRGLMPPDRSRDPASVSAMVASFPPHRRATIAPWDDASLRSFRGCDLAVACAVKYAGDHVLVVSLPSHRLGADVDTFARERGVRVLRLSREAFEPAALERLSLDHNVPAPAHWDLPFAWCERFLPEIGDV